MWSCAAAGQISRAARSLKLSNFIRSQLEESEKERKKERDRIEKISMHTFVWVDHLAKIEEFFSASDHDFIHVLIGQKITTDGEMNNSGSNNSSTQPSEEGRKNVWKAGHKQEVVDELVACGKDNTNTSYSGSTVYFFGNTDLKKLRKLRTTI